MSTIDEILAHNKTFVEERAISNTQPINTPIKS